MQIASDQPQQGIVAAVDAVAPEAPCADPGMSTHRPARILSGDYHRAAQTPPTGPDPVPVAPAQVCNPQPTRRFGLLRRRFLFSGPAPGPARHTPLPHGTLNGMPGKAAGKAATPASDGPQTRIVDANGELVLSESQMVTPPQQVRGFGRRGGAKGRAAGGLVRMGGEGFGRKGGALHLPTIFGDLFKRLQGRRKPTS